MMPNLERCPHLLSTRSMTERKRQANTARATATDTWGQRGGGSGSCCGAGSLLPTLGVEVAASPLGKLRQGEGRGLPSSPSPSHPVWLRVWLCFTDLSCVPLGALVPPPQITEPPVPAEPSPQRCARPSSPRAPPASCSWCLGRGEGRRVSVGWGTQRGQGQPRSSMSAAPALGGGDPGSARLRGDRGRGSSVPSTHPAETETLAQHGGRKKTTRYSPKKRTPPKKLGKLRHGATRQRGGDGDRGVSAWRGCGAPPPAGGVRGEHPQGSPQPLQDVPGMGSSGLKLKGLSMKRPRTLRAAAPRGLRTRRV